MVAVGRSRLAVVVVNYGSHGLLESNLWPVSVHTPDAQVVVVDNYTTATERATVVEQASVHGWELVLPDDNLGFGVGMNAGVARAAELGADVFLLLNPDASIDPTSLDVLRSRVDLEPLTLVSPTVLRPDGTVWFAGTDLYLDTGEMRSSRRRVPGARVEPWLSGACLMVSKQLWALVGGFADGYFLYWEDVDLSHRVSVAGGALLVDPTATAVHAEGGTQNVDAHSASTAKSPAYYYYNTRNRLLYAARHLSPQDRRRWARSSLSAACEILLQGGRRQLTKPWRPVSAVVRGTTAGLILMRKEVRGAEAGGLR